MAFHMQKKEPKLRTRPQLHKCLGPAFLAVLLFLFLSTPAAAAEDYDTNSPFSVQFTSGLLFSPVIQNGQRKVLNYSMTAVRLGYSLPDEREAKAGPMGSRELLFEAVYSSVTKGFGDYMAGLSFLFRYNFLGKNNRFVPYFQLGAGIVYNDIYKDGTQELIGQAIEFTPEASLGLHILMDRHWSVDLEAIFHHVSNANLADRNVGVNALGGLLCLTYYF